MSRRPLSREQEKAMFAGGSPGSGITRADMDQSHLPGYNLHHKPQSTSRLYVGKLVQHARNVKDRHNEWKKRKVINETTEKQATQAGIASEEKEKIKQLNLDLVKIRKGDLTNEEAKRLLKNIKETGNGVIPKSTIDEIEKIVNAQLKMSDKERRGVSKTFPSGAHNPTNIKIVENIGTESKTEPNVKQETPETESQSNETSEQTPEKKKKQDMNEDIQKTISDSDIPDKLKGELLAVDPQVAV